MDCCGRAKAAKEQSLIAEYKEKIELVKTEARIENNGEVTLEILKTSFDKPIHEDWVNNTEIITDTDDNNIEKVKLVTNDTYIFYVTGDTTEYKGNNGVIIRDTSKITISASPADKKDSSVTSLTINVTIDYTVNITSGQAKYAWKEGSTATVADGEWSTLTLNSSGDKVRTAQIQAKQSTDGDYYLWIKAIINGKEEIKSFGEYKFQANPTDADLVCRSVGTADNDTKLVMQVGINKVFEGWTLSYKLNTGSYTEITNGTTTVNAVKGDVIVVKYSKQNETDVEKSVNIDDLKLSYTLKYNANGGTNAPADQVKYSNNQFTITASEPTKEGSAFNGWYLNTGGTGTKYNSGDSITVNNTEQEITLYASWGDLTAAMIDFEPDDENWNVSTVEEALNYLYTHLNTSN